MPTSDGAVRLLRGGAVSFAVLLLCAACSFDYGNSAVAAANEEPSATFVDFKHTVYSQGTKILELSANRAESYDADSKTLLFGVSFTEYDRSTGKVSTRGSADEATFYNATESAEFYGSIHIESVSNNAVLTAEHLSWNGKDKLLSSGLDRDVEIQRGDGSWVRGAGFLANARRRSFSFKGSVEGAVVSSDDAAPSAGKGTSP
jgi:LPS export ABC transporter protein LptC